MNRKILAGERRLLLLFFVLFVLSFLLAAQPAFAETTTTTTTSGNTTTTVTVVTTTATDSTGKTTTTKVTTTATTTYKEMAFSDMTAAQKSAVLSDLIAKKIIKNSIKVNNGTEGLNITNWNTNGIISYGETAAVNAAVKVTNSPNYDSATGQWRYWGYDINGGLYGNDNFPRDSDTGKAAYKKNWLTTDEIKRDTTAYNYVGGYTVGLGFSDSDKKATAQAFLDENPAWLNYKNDYGDTTNVDYILDHFFFNSVLGASGITQGQFIGVHRSAYDGNLYYQTFSVKKGLLTRFSVPSPTTIVTTTETDDGTPVIVDPVIPPAADPTVLAEAHLDLAAKTYCGHPAYARDESTFSVDGVDCSAAYAYANNLASNSFNAPGGHFARTSNTQGTVVYDDPGTYDVTLKVRPKGGGMDQDIQSIEVLPTPKIIATLTGTQKANRKQLLNLQVATDPDDPLIKLTVRLEHLDGEGNPDESVMLVHLLGNGINTLLNSDTIKTRAIEALASDGFFTNCRLAFLTKNGDDTKYRYIIYAKTAGGADDTVTTDFDVAKDKPPIAAIGIPGYFIRGASSDTANISAADTTTTDGDQIDRTWYYRPVLKAQTESAKQAWTAVTKMLGYSDDSFGTGKIIGLNKTGCGLFEIRLDAKDNWTEETLPEYVTDADHLTGSAVAASEVINIAPIVSLKPIIPKTANVTILTGGQSEYDVAVSNKALIQQSLLQNGVAADITVQKMSPAASASEGSGAVAVLDAGRTPSGYNSEWTSYEDKNFMVDEECFYKLSASWPNAGFEGYPQSPYTITCWDTKTGSIKWNYSFNDSLLSVNSASLSLAQDDSGKYLFLNTNGKTLILTKDTGSYLTLLNFDIGSNVYAADSKIYSLRNDGIYAVSAKSGAITRICSAAVFGDTRRINGEIHFLTARGGGICRGIFNTSKESARMEPLGGGAYASLPFLSGMTCIGIDTAGKLGTYYPGTETVTIYGRDNKEVNKFAGSGVDAAFMITDAQGVCNYIGMTAAVNGSTYNYNYAYCYGLTNGYSNDLHIRGSDYQTESSRILFAREINGQVHICTGANWVWTAAGLGFSAYPERTNDFMFAITKGTSAASYGGAHIGLDMGTYEYGTSSDVLTAYQTNYNYTDSTAYEQNLVAKWNQTLPMILNRYTSKCFSAGADVNALVIFDETNSSSLYSGDLISSLSAAIASKNGKLIIANKGDMTGSGLGEEILGLTKGSSNLLGAIVPEGTTGTLKKSYALKPNTTYYYEYDEKTADGKASDIVTESSAIAGMPLAAYSSDKYMVLGSQTEDFGDTDTNPFFMIPTGNIEDGWLKLIQAGGRKVILSSSCTISFTVPAGQTGMLSFDWYQDGCSGNAGNWMNNYIDIDGMPMYEWEINTSGHYSHPYLLAAGTHTITLHAGIEGTGTSNTWIKNLSVDLLSPTAGSSVPAASSTQETENIETLSDGFSHVTGSFKTPIPTASYDLVTNATPLTCGISSAYSSYTDNGSHSNPTITTTLNIPTGYVAPFFSLYKTSYETPKSTATLNWLTDSHVWYSYGDSVGNVAFADYPDNSQITFPTLSGTQQFKTIGRSNSNGNSSIGIEGFTMLLTDTAHAGLIDYNGFFGNAGYYVQNNNYQGTTLSFMLQAGTSLMKNYRLYYLAPGGMKIYADQDDFSDSASLSGWTAGNAATAIVQEEIAEKNDDSLVYKKGQLVAYKAGYFDYEADPSKQQYWKYTHMPMNDGANPDAAVIMDEQGNVISITNTVFNAPITRFYIDGKYIVEHWQEDDTTKGTMTGGDPDYDLTSNHVFLTFYIEGGGEAPWIESIKTLPAAVTEGVDYSVAVRVNDAEKDVLRLTTEVYEGGELIYRENRTGITAANGVYPTITTKTLPEPAGIGKYEIVCTVRDWSGAGLGSYRFTVVSENKITASVYHTDQWEINRKRFNLYYSNDEINRITPFEEYSAMELPRKRGTNVFWAGERFLLSASVAGNAKSVTAEILEKPSYKTTLQKSGVISTGKSDTSHDPAEVMWTGDLWNAALAEQLRTDDPTLLTFRFTAVYTDGSTKSYDVPVIADNSLEYWLLHRAW